MQYNTFTSRTDIGLSQMLNKGWEILTYFEREDGLKLFVLFKN